MKLLALLVFISPLVYLCGLYIYWICEFIWHFVCKKSFRRLTLFLLVMIIYGIATTYLFLPT